MDAKQAGSGSFHGNGSLIVLAHSCVAMSFNLQQISKGQEVPKYIVAGGSHMSLTAACTCSSLARGLKVHALRLLEPSGTSEQVFRHNCLACSNCTTIDYAVEKQVKRNQVHTQTVLMQVPHNILCSHPSASDGVSQ